MRELRLQVCADGITRLNVRLTANSRPGDNSRVRYLDLTLSTPAENLALDEALLEEAEAAGCPRETLRVWEFDRPVVVVGRSSRVQGEVHGDVCRELEIPVLRRISGGGAVVAGPGCLMYSLVLSYRRRPALRSLDHAHRFVLGTLATALTPLAPGLRPQGICDLAVGERKVSGNSVRAKRDHMLYHGTLLYRFPLDLIGRCLAMPPREPAYRGSRPHEAFVTNLAADAAAIRRALQAAWEAAETCHDWPAALIARLAATLPPTGVERAIRVSIELVRVPRSPRPARPLLIVCRR